jgi:hypothetical protein
MWCVLGWGLALVNVIMLGYMSWEYSSIKIKIRDEKGNCEECGYPERGAKTFTNPGPHHVNCPLGRLGL